MSPLLFLLPSTLNTGCAYGSHLIGRLSRFTALKSKKFSVALQSSKVFNSALFSGVCTRTVIIIEQQLDRYTQLGTFLLIQAEQIRCLENLK